MDPILVTPTTEEQAELACATARRRRTDPDFVVEIDRLCYSIREDGLYCYPPERSAEAVKIATYEWASQTLDAIYDGHRTPAEALSELAATVPDWMTR